MRWLRGEGYLYRVKHYKDHDGCSIAVRVKNVTIHVEFLDCPDDLEAAAQKIFRDKFGIFAELTRRPAAPRPARPADPVLEEGAAPSPPPAPGRRATLLDFV